MKKGFEVIVSLLAILLVNTSFVVQAYDHFGNEKFWLVIVLLGIVDSAVIFFMYRYFKRKSTVPILKNRISLDFSHRRFEKRKSYTNNVDIELMHVTNQMIDNGSDVMDCNVSFNFKGTAKSKLQQLKLSVYGTKFQDYEKMGMVAHDKHNKDKKYEILLKSPSVDSQLKDVVVIFNPALDKGDSFDIVLSWHSERGFKHKEGLIGLPNYFSKAVKEAILELDVSNTSIKAPIISAFHYKVNFPEPQWITNNLRGDEGKYRLHLNHPEDYSDYFIYYENR